MPLEVPYHSPFPLAGNVRYDPMMIGQTADTCPTRSLWWLLVAAAAGAAGGWQLSKAQRPQRRRR